MKVTRTEVLRYRVHAQELGHEGPRGDARILDLGVQETGHGGARWALEIRGCRPVEADLFRAWTLRGAPHAYRRAEAAEVAAATAPWNDADAAKRIFDAARPLRAAGIPVTRALAVIAGEMHDLAREPIGKGDLSRGLSERLGEPYLRFCRPCDAVHTYEQPFRLAALQAGLELEPGTSPPVLRRIPGWAGPAATVPPHLDPVRAALRLLGPADPRLVAGYLDSPVREVAARWPEDVVAVEVGDRRLHVLAEDAGALAEPPEADSPLLLGPFDLFLQARDRELVLPDEGARKDLWRTLGRPGGVLAGHEVVGSWRPRSTGGKLRIAVSTWGRSSVPTGLTEQAERLAAFRGQAFDGFVAG